MTQQLCRCLKMVRHIMKQCTDYKRLCGKSHFPKHITHFSSTAVGTMAQGITLQDYSVRGHVWFFFQILFWFEHSLSPTYTQRNVCSFVSYPVYGPFGGTSIDFQKLLRKNRTPKRSKRNRRDDVIQRSFASSKPGMVR